MELETKVTLVFKDKENNVIHLKTSLKDMLERNLNDFYEDIKPPCTCSSCNNESQNFCDCGSAWEDYVIKEVLI